MDFKINDRIIITNPHGHCKDVPDELVGRSGLIVDLCYDRDFIVRGAWIELIGQPYQDEKEWYIPIIQLKNDDSKIRK